MVHEVSPLELAKSLQLLRVGWVRCHELRHFDDVTPEALDLLTDRGWAECAFGPQRWSVTSAGLLAYERGQEAAGRALLG